MKIKGNEKYEFTVFSYNATVLLIQPNPNHHMCWKMRPNSIQLNPTHGWTQPMSISDVATASESVLTLRRIDTDVFRWDTA